MPDIDCRTIDCKKLERAFVNGVSDQEMFDLGIDPASDRARRLRVELARLFVYCCAQNAGTVPPEPPEEEPTALAAGTLALPLAGGGYAFDGAMMMRWIRAGLWGAVLYVVWLILQRAHLQLCPLVRGRDFMGLECLYRCPNGEWHKLSRFEDGARCPQFILMPR